MGKRTTQYIGLHHGATKYLVNNGFKPIPTDNQTTGMFGEPVPLGEWNNEQGAHIREVVQAEPWSSGPMIFTCLQRDGQQLCKWEEDENISNEFSYEDGKFYV